MNNLTSSDLVFKSVFRSSIIAFPDENELEEFSRGTVQLQHRSRNEENQKQIRKSLISTNEEKETDLKDPILRLMPFLNIKEDVITIHILSVLSPHPLTFTVDKKKTIYLLKSKIQKTIYTPPDMQHLIYDLKNLKSQKTFEHYKIDNNDTISLVIQERAGGCFAFTSNSYLRLENGQTKMIKDLRYGDMVKTERGFSKVLKITAMKNEEFVLIQTEKRTLKCTPKQAFVVPGQKNNLFLTYK